MESREAFSHIKWYYSDCMYIYCKLAHLQDKTCKRAKKLSVKKSYMHMGSWNWHQEKKDQKKVESIQQHVYSTFEIQTQSCSSWYYTNSITVKITG